LRGSYSHQNASSQQVEAGASIALALQHLEAVNLSLALLAAPGLDQGGPYRCAIRLQPGRERLDDGTLRANDSETLSPREFNLEGAEG